MNLDKKFDVLEREILKITQKLKELYRENIDLKESIKILKERERYLLSEIENLKRRNTVSLIKKRLEKLSSIIEKELNR